MNSLRSIPEKYRLLAIAILLLLTAVMVGIYLAAPQAEHKPAQTSETSNPRLPTHTLTATAASVQKPVPAAGEDRPFWEDAVVPDPARPRLPLAALPPQRNAPAIPRDHAAEMRAIEAQGSAAQINDTLQLWFAQDPEAATAWVNQTPRFADLAPSLGSLAQSIASTGAVETALLWANAISDPTQRHETRLRIYAQEARSRRVTAVRLQELGFSPTDIQIILSGTLTD